MNGAQEDCLELLPLKISESLHNFQNICIKSAVKTEGRIFIADEMGLGKSIQALSIAYIYRTDWPLLIVCPSSLLLQWKDQILNWFHPIIIESSIVICSDKKSIHQPCRIFLISYSKLHYLLEKKSYYKSVILDECHYIKNPNTKRFKIVASLLKNALRIIMLSATPISSSSFIELATQYRVFSLPSTNIGINEPKPKNFIQRFKSDAGLKISSIPKERHLISINLSPEVTKKLLSTKHDLHPTTWEIEFSKQKTICFLNQYYEWLLSLGKLIIFYKHEEIRNITVNYMVSRGLANEKIVSINGKTNPADRIEMLKYFIDSGNAQFLVMQILIGATGLDLHKLNKILFLQLHYNPSILFQAEDRIHRIGQTTKCNIYYVCSSDPKLLDVSSIIPNLTGKIDFMVKHEYTNDQNTDLSRVLKN